MKPKVQEMHRVVPDGQRRRPEGRLSKEQLGAVEDWSVVYDELYREGHANGEAGELLEGWIDAYTGRPYPTATMHEWRAATVARIRALRPKRLLDIGAGSGMFARIIATEVAAYYAIDSTVAGLQSLMDSSTSPASLRVAQRAAHEVTLDLVDNRPVDLVVINSVIQHFPDRGYLDHVLESVATLLAPGGALLLGDVCDGRRQDVRHRELAHRDCPWATPAELDRAAARRARLSRELAPDPWTLRVGDNLLPEVFARCLCDSDLSRHRVDVVVRRGGPARQHEQTTLRWEGLSDLESVRRARAEGLLREGLYIDAPDGLLSALGPTHLEAKELTPAGADGVRMHPHRADRLILSPEGI